MSSRDVWPIRGPWVPGIVETVVYMPGGEPRLAFAYVGRPEGASQFIMRRPPASEEVDAAVAYALFSRVYLTFCQVPSPSPDDVSQATPNDTSSGIVSDSCG